MTHTVDKLVDKYLKRLNSELAGLPGDRRREVVQGISEHIAEARSDTGESEAEIRSLFDRLGDPAEIAADTRERLGLAQARSGRLEIATLVLLVIGGLFFFVGWIVGVVLLWGSKAWTTRDKLIGTLVVPGGVGGALLLVGALFAGAVGSSSCGTTGTGDLVGAGGVAIQPSTCSGGTSGAVQALLVILAILWVLASIASPVYLARRMNRVA
jgi:uncharacterized membrane protein